ncbi:MAG: glycosyl transferase group 1 [Bacteroidetes bacterium]|nr:glycosyl transferase group 1 [Bacteroidota bacterium]
MKILIVSPYVPHPLAGHGGGVYIYDMIRHLSTVHELTLISFADEHERRFLPDLSPLLTDMHIVPRLKGPVRNIGTAVRLAGIRGLQFVRSIVAWEPFIASKFRSRAMARTIRELTSSQHFDIVQIEYTQMGQYARNVQSGKTVLHQIDVLLRTIQRYTSAVRSPFARAWYRLEWCRLDRFENRMIHLHNGITTLTQPDAFLLEWQTHNRQVEVLSPGVDLPAPPEVHTRRDSDTLLFVGNLSQIPNDDAAIWLCTDIFPRIVAGHPTATLTIIGRLPSQDLRAAATDSRIRLLDFVEDLHPYLFRAGVFVAPLRLGGGIKIKILDALAHRCPIVTTPVGREGITGLTSASVCVSRSAEGLASHCIALLKDPARAADLGQKGFDVVRRNFSWGIVLDRTTRYYASLRESEYA